MSCCGKTPFPVAYYKDTSACLDLNFKVSESPQNLFIHSMEGSPPDWMERPWGLRSLSSTAKDNKHAQSSASSPIFHHETGEVLNYKRLDKAV